MIVCVCVCVWGGGGGGGHLSDVAECSIILDKNTPPRNFYLIAIPFTRQETRIFSQSHPLPLINEHKHPFGLKNPKCQCFLNSVLQSMFSIFRNNSYTSLFNSSTEGTLLKCMLETAHNACNSKDVDALKFQLVRHDIFYNGQNQKDCTECLLGKSAVFRLRPKSDLTLLYSCLILDLILT